MGCVFKRFSFRQSWVEQCRASHFVCPPSPPRAVAKYSSFSERKVSEVLQLFCFCPPFKLWSASLHCSDSRLLSFRQVSRMDTQKFVQKSTLADDSACKRNSASTRKMLEQVQSKHLRARKCVRKLDLRITALNPSKHAPAFVVGDETKT